MLKIKCDINLQDLKIIELYFVKSELFLLTWSCGSRQRDTNSSGWKFELNILAVKGLTLTGLTLTAPDRRIRFWRLLKSIPALWKQGIDIFLGESQNMANDRRHNISI